MKKLLLFALVLGLFAGCKKTESAPDTCYVGVWGSNVKSCKDNPKIKDRHDWKLTLNADGTGKLERAYSCEYDEYNYILSFKYTSKDNIITLTDKTIDARGNVYIGPRSDGSDLGVFMVSLITINYTCTDATHMQVQAGGTYPPFPISFLYVRIQ